jgi:uncharacterized protein (TIGR00369 family)
MSFGVEIPFVELLGFELLQFDNGHSELGFAPKAEHLNSFAVVHGGALMTLLDVAMATAARSVAPENGIVTIEMKTSFLRPAVGTLLAKGHLLHRTKTMAFVEARVLDAQLQLCATATGTFKYVNRATPPAGMAPRISTD